MYQTHIEKAVYENNHFLFTKESLEAAFIYKVLVWGALKL